MRSVVAALLLASLVLFVVPGAEAQGASTDAPCALYHVETPPDVGVTIDPDGCIRNFIDSKIGQVERAVESGLCIVDTGDIIHCLVDP